MKSLLTLEELDAPSLREVKEVPSIKTLSGITINARSPETAAKPDVSIALRFQQAEDDTSIVVIVEPEELGNEPVRVWWIDIDFLAETIRLTPTITGGFPLIRWCCKASSDLEPEEPYTLSLSESPELSELLSQLDMADRGDITFIGNMLNF